MRLQAVTDYALDTVSPVAFEDMKRLGRKMYTDNIVQVQTLIKAIVDQRFAGK